MNNVNFFSNDQRFVQLIVYFVRVKEMECVLAVGFYITNIICV